MVQEEACRYRREAMERQADLVQDRVRTVRGRMGYWASLLDLIIQVTVHITVLSAAEQEDYTWVGMAEAA